jgi:hypothetical protein
MLLIPLAESRRFRDREPSSSVTGGSSDAFADPESRRLVQRSLVDLVLSMASSPAQFDRELEQRISGEADPNRPRNGPNLSPGGPVPPRTSLSTIKAFWRRFCNIPPFCGETEDQA